MTDRISLRNLVSADPGVLQWVCCCVLMLS